MAWIARFALVVVGTGVYLGLAVLGGGGVAAFFANPARTAVAAVTAALAVVGMWAGGNLSAGVREDRGNRWVIAALSLIGLVDAYLPAWSDRAEVWTLGGEGVRWLGVLLLAAGGALRLWPVFVLGHRFSGLVAIQRGHALVTDGVYRVVRHPSYLGLLIGAVGWGLAFRSGPGLLLAALTAVPIVARIRSEERLLQAAFGDEYRAYVARTSRLIPGVY